MKCLFPVPQECLAHLKQAAETGVGYQIVSVELKDGRCFDQAVVSEGCIIEVREWRSVTAINCHQQTQIEAKGGKRIQHTTKPNLLVHFVLVRFRFLALGRIWITNRLLYH